MKNKNNRKGFTLAELLIVVAIIAVLVAISIPIFHAQLRKARLATNQANGRAAFSAAEAAYLDYVAEHGSIKANNSSSNKHNTVTYSYFPAAGKGILNMSVNGWWIVDDNDHGNAIYTNTDVSGWNVDTQVSGDLKIGDRVAEIWTVHMDPDSGAIKRYYCAYPTTGAYINTYRDSYLKYKEIVKTLSNGGNVSQWQQQ